MDKFDFIEDDRRKVVPLAEVEDEYPAEDDDIPFEEWETEANGGSERSLRLSTGRRHELVACRIKCLVVDDSGNAAANMQYRLHYPDGSVVLGETDGNGLIDELVEGEGNVVLEAEDGTLLRVELDES